MAGTMWILLWKWQVFTQAAWTDRWQKEWISKTFRDQFWWTDKMSLEEWDLRECSTGGGVVIKGKKKGGPPTLHQPASQQGGEEEENILAGGAWRGLEVCWGCGWIFGMCSSIPGRQGVARWPRPTLGQGVAQWELSLLGTCFWRELLLGRIYFQSLVSCGLAG